MHRLGSSGNIDKLTSFSKSSPTKLFQKQKNIFSRWLNGVFGGLSVHRVELEESLIPQPHKNQAGDPTGPNAQGDAHAKAMAHPSERPGSRIEARQSNRGPRKRLDHAEYFGSLPNSCGNMTPVDTHVWAPHVWAPHVWAPHVWAPL